MSRVQRLQSFGEERSLREKGFGMQPYMGWGRDLVALEAWQPCVKAES